ncbi:MAG: hypothetical protein HSCHL_1751 [Hydrogenibacillus schlegelii]|uniref:PrsW family intramembrane metalloprotease n=1 Tax=Hydrogenibacillus schlegelii TaxID=1484 RepID=A0A2T5GBK5_HYDSH|nr:PrsW family glutamic-type intramembrane protease [Hydrogenibacillus schlegelii]PTQ53574.1 MAG: hypothetical protein HSCHL_1751 [Hydrogenibacillus schlegelii]
MTLRWLWDRFEEACHAILGRFPWIRNVYAVFAWFSLVVFLLSLLFLKDARTVFVQYLWSLYVLIQFWLIGRSKTITWRTYTAFFLAGGWVIAPLVRWVVSALNRVFGLTPSDVGSMAVLTPIVEEIFKLLPLIVFLLVARRSSSLSLSDYVLIGAATGAGFQWAEETVRRLVSTGWFGYGETLFGKFIHWEFWTLFPGKFYESSRPDLMTPSHAVETALVALGIGIALRLRWKKPREVGAYAYLFPAALLFLAILDHAAWNGQDDFPRWVLNLHAFFGAGFQAIPLLLVLWIVAIVYDYWDLNRVREELPRLPSEHWLNPLTEAYETFRVFFTKREDVFLLLAFYRERRQLGFTWLYGDEDARERGEALDGRLHQWLMWLSTAAVFLLFTWAAWNWLLTWPDADGSCFTCLFDGFTRWWGGLPWYEKAGLLFGIFALSFPLLGFWSAVGLALTVYDVAETADDLAELWRDPRKLQSPEVVLGTALTLGMMVLPGGPGKKPLASLAFRRFERHMPLPGSIGVDKTQELFRKVSTKGRKELEIKHGLDGTGIYGIPDDLVVRDGKIEAVVEAKMWSKEDWYYLATFEPRDIVYKGFSKQIGDHQRKFWIQYYKHQNSIEYLQSNLDKFPEARRLGIEVPVPIDEIRWVLKVSDSAPDEALEVIQRAFEAHGYRIEIYKVPWGKGK